MLISGEFYNIPRDFDTILYQFWENAWKSEFSKKCKKNVFQRLIQEAIKKHPLIKEVRGNERISTSRIFLKKLHKKVKIVAEKSSF